MKKNLCFAIFLCFSLSMNAQNAKNEEQLIKKDWNFGALPTITFDSDLGFQYGALVNLYDYGDGSRYPKYNQSLYFEVSRFTKGSGINRFYYDSDRLIKGLQTSVDLSYLSDQAYDFYGFNGYEAVYQPNWVDDTQPSDVYKTRMFYKYNRKLFRFKVDLQGKLAGDHFRWTTGFNLQDFKIGNVNLTKLNKGKSGSKVLPDVPGLYDLYQQWGMITPKEANGGFIPTVKGGIVYDSRDNRPNPMKGLWTEAVLEGAPSFLGSESSFLKLSLIHREYFTLVPASLSLVYRVAYQTTLAGTTPFYYQSQVITSVLTGALSEGLGGAKTLRGILRNRIVGDGFVYGNVELRWKVARFHWINNNFYIGLNGFTDFGKVTKEIDVRSKLTPNVAAMTDYFNWGAEKLHTSYGAGLRLVMNENFVVAADYGIAANQQDGISGLYIGLNYLF
jgi:hypothetical protein